MKTAFFLASRAIRKSNRGTLIVILIIMSLSVVNLLFMPTFLDSVDKVSTQTDIDMQYGHVIIDPKEGNEFIKDGKSVAEKVLLLPEVVGISEHYETRGIFRFQDKVKSYGVTFINPDDEKSVTQISQRIVEGDYLSKFSKDEILIGKTVAGRFDTVFKSDSLGDVYVGDKIEVEFTNGFKKTYAVAGIFNSGSETVDFGVFLPWEEMKNVYGGYKDTNRIIIRLNKADRSYPKKLQELGIGEDVFYSMDRYGLSLSQTFYILKIILGSIAFIVSGVTLFIVIYINAVNKRKLIATMKAVGVNNRSIVLSFIMQSLFYALIGIIFGLMIVFGLIVPYFDANPLQFPMGRVNLIIDMTMVTIYLSVFLLISMIAGFIPSYQITRKNIIETMRS